MRAQNFLGDKNSNPRLSDQFWATKDVTYIYVSTSELRDSFHSLLKSQDSRQLQKEIKSSWDGKVENKKQDFKTSSAKNSSLWGTKNCSEKKDCETLTIQLKYCETLIFGKTIRQT